MRMCELSNAEKHMLFGKSVSEEVILKKFFNRDFVKVLNSHLLPPAVALNIISGKEALIDCDTYYELCEFATKIRDYIHSTCGKVVSLELITIYGLFYGLYLNESNSITVETYGDMREIKLGNLVVYNSSYNTKAFNLIQNVFLRKRYSHIAEEPDNVIDVLNFLTSYVKKYLYKESIIEFKHKIELLAYKKYGVDIYNLDKNISRLANSSLNNRERLRNEIARKLFFYDLSVREFTLEEIFHRLTSNCPLLSFKGV